MNLEFALTELDAFLDRRGADLQDGFTRKFRSRAVILEAPEFPGCVVFEIERHRGVLGTRYRQGVPMSSFITYWLRFSFDVKIQALDRIGPARNSVWTFGDSVDTEVGRFCFRFEAQDDGRVRVIEKESGRSAVVRSLEQAQEFAANLVSEWDLSRYAEEASGVLAEGQASEYLAAVRHELQEAARRRMADYWEILRNPAA